MAPLHTATTSCGTPVYIVDPLALRPSPVCMDRYPVCAPWERAAVPRRLPRKRVRADAPPPDPFCDAQLLAAAVDTVRTFRQACRLRGVPWWTRRLHDVCVCAADDVDLPAYLRGAPAAHAARRADGDVCGAELVHTLVTNDGGSAATLLWHRRNAARVAFALPPRSAFLVADLLAGDAAARGSLPHSWAPVVDLGVSRAGGVDVVVMDPPWPNLSARRLQLRDGSRGYDVLSDMYELWHLRPVLESLLARGRPGGSGPLVAIWVTNHPKVQHFVHTKFLSGFGLHCVGVWGWLKLTASPAEDSGSDGRGAAAAGRDGRDNGGPGDGRGKVLDSREGRDNGGLGGGRGEAPGGRAGEDGATITNTEDADRGEDDDAGLPVLSLANLSRRRPYELLILARPAAATPTQEHGDKRPCDTAQDGAQRSSAHGPPPARLLLACPPLSHSQKPNVDGKYGATRMLTRAELLLGAAGRTGGDGVVVELFARHAAEGPAHGWHVSVGNEAVRARPRV
ncbi:hypothetical protein MSPP1_000177 [Malassezia sp. CBS 17886]|nr:hypothetical protein MSPP1_000177 [Malassezia sp. CBS 17886]